MLVDRNTIARLDGPVVEQLQAIGQHFWGTKTLQEIWAKTECHQLAWLHCPTVDDCEQRLADVWTAKCKGDVVFGIVFPPDRAEPLPHIVWEGRQFIGTTPDAQQLVPRII